MSSLAKQRVPLNCKTLVQVNGRPLELVQPEALSFKLQEPILLLGKDRFADIDIRIRVKGGGHTSQVSQTKYN